ncbi:MAG: cellobiose phosphorylase [Candidatus Omnitrophota bacterium]
MPKKTTGTKPKYYLNPAGEFVIENYNSSKPFANFFPGIAGKYGIPLWAFYVNRGQCLSSFGTKDKDHAILEFFPANKAWQTIFTYGFRTFIKARSGKKTSLYEPFRYNLDNKTRVINRMRITSSGLVIEEENKQLGIKVCVEYFNIPNDSYAGLSRIVRIENTSSKTLSCELIDGLAQIVPFGTNNFFLKKMGRTIEAWMNVENLDKNAPFYKLDVDPGDRPEVVHIDEGNFCVGYHFESKKSHLLKPIVDPEAVFGKVTDFSYPAEFMRKTRFSYPKKQIIKSRTPSALLFLNLELKAKENKILYSIFGQARDIRTLNNSIKKITSPGYLEGKSKENAQLIKDIQQDISTKSSSREFNLYAAQTYIDNIMRGGYPEIFRSGALFYLYSRKHGDLERDYNKFQLQPTYFSQGNGNYRDINQNRRSDIWFNPEVLDANLVYFINLIQSDGFNPLIIKGESFKIQDASTLNRLLEGSSQKENIEKIINFLKKPFTPGELIFFIEKNNIKLQLSYDELLDKLLAASIKIEEAEHGEGFWTDHWTYNLDLIDSYLGVYPEKVKELFFGKRIFTFYDNAEIVKPRSEKYVLHNKLPRQLHAISLDTAKKEIIRKRTTQPHSVRTLYGAGDIYYTTLLNKLLCLAVNKLASLDPFGAGLEMEANKPNWFDSLNGLPALFGSSTCETFELKRLLLLLKEILQESSTQVYPVTEEITEFINHLLPLFSVSPFLYWDKSSAAKEAYRHKTRLGFSGKENDTPAGVLLDFINQGLEKVERSLETTLDKKTGVYYSYFINEVEQYDLANEHFVIPKKFAQKPVVLFLEGQMHALRLAGNQESARKLHHCTKKSALFDKKLKMYKVTTSLKSMPEEIGRCRIFTPGWLENESIWLHMEYKYLLELLKNGLAAEFYEEFKNVLIPFQKPQKYGRSILENSSFLASSAFNDEKLQGNGFVARLSGSTAEFLQIWLTMNAGIKPFRCAANGGIELGFQPILKADLFDHKGDYSFNFLSRIPVTYHNPAKKDTFGKKAAKITRIILWKEQEPVELRSCVIPSPYAEAVRSRQIEKIDIYLE